MSMDGIPNNVSPDKSYFLSDILGKKVLRDGKKIGKLADLIIKENGKAPIVAKTNQEGKAHFQHLPVTTCHIEVTAPGFKSKSCDPQAGQFRSWQFRSGGARLFE